MKRPEKHVSGQQREQAGANRVPRSMLVWASIGVALLALAFTFGLTFGGLGGSSKSASSEQHAGVAADGATTSTQNGIHQPERVRDLPARWEQSALRSGPVPVVVDPPSVDLGTAARQTRLNINATLRNTGDELLRIAASRADCGCTAVDMAGQIIEPGGTIELAGTFDTRAKPGERTAIITMIFEGYSEPVRIPVRAMVE